MIMGILMVLLLTFWLTSCVADITSQEVQQCLEHGDKVKRLKKFEDESIKEVYLAENSDHSRKQVLQIAEGQGFNGKIKFLLAIDTDQNKISSLKILEHNESENYGCYVEEPWFLEKFENIESDLRLSLVKLSASNSAEIVAITGATVTSRGIVEGVNKCLENYKKIRGEIIKR